MECHPPPSRERPTAHAEDHPEPRIDPSAGEDVSGAIARARPVTACRNLFIVAPPLNPVSPEPAAADGRRPVTKGKRGGRRMPRIPGRTGLLRTDVFLGPRRLSALGDVVLMSADALLRVAIEVVRVLPRTLAQGCGASLPLCGPKDRRTAAFQACSNGAIPQRE